MLLFQCLFSLLFNTIYTCPPSENVSHILYWHCCPFYVFGYTDHSWKWCKSMAKTDQWQYWLLFCFCICLMKVSYYALLIFNVSKKLQTCTSKGHRATLAVVINCVCPIFTLWVLLPALSWSAYAFFYFKVFFGPLLIEQLKKWQETVKFAFCCC